MVLQRTNVKVCIRRGRAEPGSLQSAPTVTGVGAGVGVVKLFEFPPNASCGNHHEGKSKTMSHAEG